MHTFSLMLPCFKHAVYSLCIIQYVWPFTLVLPFLLVKSVIFSRLFSAIYFLSAHWIISCSLLLLFPSLRLFIIACFLVQPYQSKIKEFSRTRSFWKTSNIQRGRKNSPVNTQLYQLSFLFYTLNYFKGNSTHCIYC